MKYLMVKRCEAKYTVDEGLYRICHGLDRVKLTYKELGKVREYIRCEEPLGHKGPGHHGSEADRERHLFSWDGWGEVL